MNNPYQTITPSVYPSNSQELVATQTAVNELAKCKGWVRFISVLCFILFGIFILGFIGILTMVSRMGGSSGLMLIVYLVFLVVTFFLALRLTGYANAIGRLVHSRNPIDLETAMIQQLKFWRLYGIVMIASILIKIFTLMTN